MFLFEALDDDQLDWLSENGYCKTWLAGEEVYTEGEPATCFFVLLSGTLSMHRRVENTEVETARTNQRGVYARHPVVRQRYGRAAVLGIGTRRDRLRVLGDRRGGVGEKFREWFPMAVHLLEGLTRACAPARRSSGSGSVCFRWAGYPRDSPTS